MRASSSRLVYIMVLAGVFSVSTSSVLIKMADAHAAVVVLYRMLFSALFTSVIMMRLSHGEIKKLSRADTVRGLFGGLFLALHFLTWILSLQNTTIAASTTLVSLHPVCILFFNYLVHGERYTRLALCGAAAALVGVAIIGAGHYAGNGQSFSGDVLALLGAVFMAAYLLVGRSVRARVSVWTYTTGVYWVAAVIMLIVSLSLGLRIFDYPARTFVIFVALAAVPTLLGHTVFNWALGFVSPAFISVAVLGEPVGATFLGLIVLGEVPTARVITGGLLVVCGLAVFASQPVMTGRRPQECGLNE
ncbi:MAG: DMT family transporter [Bacillota bacterium]